jgi:hypothetical protein
MRGSHFLPLAISTANALSVIDFDTCSLPYIIPISLQTSCDRSDEWLASTRDATEDGEIVFSITPPDNVTASSISTKPTIWTHEPFCIESEEARAGYCVYTSTLFGNGRGISIVATPKEMSALVEGVSTFKLPNDAESFKSLEGALHKQYQQQVPGKGVGVFANATLQRGDYLAGYLPILMLQDDMMQYAKIADQDLLVKIAVERLPKKTQALFNALHGQFPGHPYVSKIQTNAFQAYAGGAKDHFWGVLPESSRYNHDCRPNTAYYFDRESMTHRIYVTEKLNPGEEITLTYSNPYLKHNERKEFIKKGWDFDCTCSKCMASKSLRALSDHRLTLIKELEEQLNDLSPDRIASPSTALALVNLYEQEHLHGPIGDAYMHVALEYSFIGDRNRALVWAAKALEGLALWRGESHTYYRSMWALTVDITTHRSWRYIANGYRTQDGSLMQPGKPSRTVRMHGGEYVSNVG